MARRKTSPCRPGNVPSRGRTPHTTCAHADAVSSVPTGSGAATYARSASDHHVDARGLASRRTVVPRGWLFLQLPRSREVLDQDVRNTAPVGIHCAAVVGFRRPVSRDRQGDIKRGVQEFDVIFFHVRILFLCSCKSMTASVNFISAIVRGCCSMSGRPPWLGSLRWPEVGCNPCEPCAVLFRRHFEEDAP